MLAWEAGVAVDALARLIVLHGAILREAASRRLTADEIREARQALERIIREAGAVGVLPPKG